MKRKYGRRKAEILRKHSDDSLNDIVSQAEYLSSSSSPEIEPLNFSGVPFSSQESSSSLWNSCSRSTFLDHDFSQNGYGVRRRAKRPKKAGEAFRVTKTLMENQHEVNFALYGLKKGHQVMIRRAALSSLLSICQSQYQRRSLRAQGTSQSIIDAILALTLDDIPSNLAAATLFFVLTADGQDDHFMESPGCIKFLIKLLRPVVSARTKRKPRNIGSRLLSIIKDVDAAHDAVNMHDSSSCDILSRAQQILLNCKELRLIDSYITERMRPDLSSKWVALLAMEKACLSQISFDDTSATVKKTKGMFKEKLRELGGLDAVFEVVVDCHAALEDMKDDLNKQSLMLLLKCLKIMENAALLSTENQNHMLSINGSMGSDGSQRSFTDLIISVIKMLSGLQLGTCKNEKHPHPHYANGVNRGSISEVDCKDDPAPSVSGSQSSVTSIDDPSTLTTRIGSKTRTFAGRLASLGSGISRSFASLEDSQDPFAFDVEDAGPSKWLVVTGKHKAQKRKGSCTDIKSESSHQLYSSQEESNHWLNSQEESSYRSHNVTKQPSSTYDIDRKCLCLLPDCLLTAVKVLMNLTNDNSVGCRKIAVGGGLESMGELLVGHFPSFTSSPLFGDREIPGMCHQKDKLLTDQELDFLVAILGLLVNLVEKDRINRSRLAAASVPITNPEGLHESEQDMIPLLCSIFLTNHGSADTKEETNSFTLDDKEAVLESEKEAEKTIVEAYSALLLAFLSTESRSIRNAIRDYLPKRNLAILVPVLDRFVAFHTTLNMIPPETHKAVMEVIESCKLP